MQPVVIILTLIKPHNFYLSMRKYFYCNIRGNSSNSFSQNEEIEENYSYTEPSGSPTTSSPQRPLQEREEPSINTETGMNTQNELAEKLEFFKNLEEEKSNLDYGKMNKMLDEETSARDRIPADDLLQATGVELGNSIFNATGMKELCSGSTQGSDSESVLHEERSHVRSCVRVLTCKAFVACSDRIC